MEDVTAFDSEVGRPSFVSGRGRVGEAYQWLPEHPVTLQSRWSPAEGHSHVARGREEEWTWVEEGGRAIVFLLLRGIVVSRSNIQRVVGGTAISMT